MGKPGKAERGSFNCVIEVSLISMGVLQWILMQKRYHSGASESDHALLETTLSKPRHRLRPEWIQNKSIGQEKDFCPSWDVH
ncbi:hypothetical protein Y1Q_0013628 [Alligator mississippiensis]|uniref:Uncharacterized protein n=1 Tax=Alligator mississippiensis TaxID=8496 RepID=A0A151P3H4_ALLMI|nr:hypothetical protein Y1Q_0013628 [Alligator mississippiensis]